MHFCDGTTDNDNALVWDRRAQRRGLHAPTLLATVQEWIQMIATTDELTRLSEWAGPVDDYLTAQSGNDDVGRRNDAVPRLLPVAAGAPTTRTMDDLLARVAELEAAQAGGTPTGAAPPRGSPMFAPRPREAGRISAYVAKALAKPPRGELPPPRTRGKARVSKADMPLTTDENDDDLEDDEELEHLDDGRKPLRADDALAAAIGKLATILSQDRGDGLLGLDSSSTGGSAGIRGSAARQGLQNRLLERPGAISNEVQANMRRRLGRYMNEGVPPDPQEYLERTGGFASQRSLGLIAWMLGDVLNCLWRDDLEGAADRTALSLLMVDQANLDGGQMDVAWLMGLAEEPPSGVFARPTLSGVPNSRAFTPLASPQMVTSAIAYLRELDTLQTRRAELGRARRGPPAAASGGGDDPASLGPIVPKPKGRQRRGKPGGDA